MATAKDLKDKYKDLDLRMKSLKSKISSKLFQLCKQNPDVIIDHTSSVSKTPNMPIKTNALDKMRIITSLSITTQLTYIDVIEKYLEQKHQHRQLEFDYD